MHSLVSCERAERMLQDNLSALLNLRTKIHMISVDEPSLLAEWQKLIDTGRYFQLYVRRYKHIKRRINPLGIADIAACLTLAPWAFDVWKFSRKIGAWEI